MIKAFNIRMLIACWWIFTLSGCGAFHYQQTTDFQASFDWEGVSSDIKKGSYLWTEEYIHSMVSSGLMKQEFVERPYEFISRGDFIFILNKSMDYSDTTQQNPYLDLDPEDPRYQAITNCFHQGIIDEDVHFYPDQYLTRTTAAQWLIRAKGGQTLDQEAINIVEPLIFAQDGYREVPLESRGYLSLCLKPQHQLMYYRWKQNSEYRFIEASMPLSKAEAAFSFFHLLHPPQEGGTLRIVDKAHALNFLPDSQASQDQQNLQSLLLSPVIGYKDEYQSAFPLLIEQIPSIENGLWKINDDGSMELSFRFRKDLMWSDGKPLTANDAVFWFYVCHHPSYPFNNTEITSMINRAVAVDRQTVVIYWNQPYSYANYHIDILPQHFFNKSGEKKLSHYLINDPNYFQAEKDAVPGFRSRQYIQDEELVQSIVNSSYVSKPLHAGPYILEEGKDEKGVLSLIPNPYYLAGKALLSSIDYRLSEDFKPFLQEEETFDFDLLLGGISLESTKEIQALIPKTHALVSTPSYVWEHLDLNLDHPFLSDRRVREALLRCIDRDEIVQKYFSGLAFVAHTYLPPQHPSLDFAEVEAYPFDPIRAGQLLDEAEWLLNPETQFREKAGEILSITLLCPLDPPIREKILEELAQYWQKQGIQVQLQKVEKEVFFEKLLRERNFPGASACLYAWNFSTRSNLFTIVHSSMIPSKENQYKGQNYTAFQHSYVDELCMESFRLIDKNKLMGRLATIQEILSNDLPSLPLFFHPRLVIAKKDLMQFKALSTGASDTWNISYWYWRTN